MGADLNASDAFIRRLPRKYFIWLLAVEDLCESLLIDLEKKQNDELNFCPSSAFQRKCIYHIVERFPDLQCIKGPSWKHEWYQGVFVALRRTGSSIPAILSAAMREYGTDGLFYARPLKPLSELYKEIYPHTKPPGLLPDTPKPWQVRAVEPLDESFHTSDAVFDGIPLVCHDMSYRHPWQEVLNIILCKLDNHVDVWHGAANDRKVWKALYNAEFGEAFDNGRDWKKFYVVQLKSQFKSLGICQLHSKVHYPKHVHGPFVRRYDD